MVNGPTLRIDVGENGQGTVDIDGEVHSVRAIRLDCDRKADGPADSYRLSLRLEYREDR